MTYACFRLLGKSKDSVSYSFSSEFNGHLEKNGMIPALFDIKKARFDKLFLAGRNMAYLFNTTVEFLDNHLKDNRLYDCCVIYIKAPLYFEISAALGLLHYHIILPLLNSFGVNGEIRPLTHKNFLELFPKVVKSLEKLGEDPSKLLDRTHLEVFLPYSTSTSILKFTKQDDKIFDGLFHDINVRNESSKSVILKMCATLSLGLITVFHRQVGNLYLKGEESVVARLLADGDNLIEYAPVTNLSSERNFGHFKSLKAVYSSASTKYISSKIIGKSAPYIHTLANKPNAEWNEDISWSKYFPVAKAYRDILDSKKTVEKQCLEKKIANAQPIRGLTFCLRRLLI